MKYIREFFKLWGWVFFIGFGLMAIVGIFMQPLVAIGFLIWALIFLPPLHKITAQYGWKLNVWGRLAAFVTAFVLIGATASSKPNTVIANSTPKPSQSPTVVVTSPSPSAFPSPVAEKPWKTYLPEENKGLREKLETDPFVQGWLQGQDAWIGYATPKYLLE
jgi:hypothetical protein